MFPLPIDNAVQYLAKNPDLGTLLYSVVETKTLPGALQGNINWLFAYCKGGNFDIHIWVWFDYFIC